MEEGRPAAIVKRRSNFRAIVFTVLTAGIYGVYWYMRLTNESNSLSQYKTASGGKAVLLLFVTLGVYGFYWSYMLGKRVYDFGGGTSGPILYLALWCVGLGFVDFILAQCALNRVAAQQNTTPA